MVEQLRKHRAYILMFTLNLAVLMGVLYLLRRPEPHVVAISTPAPSASEMPARSGAIETSAPETVPPPTSLATPSLDDKVNINTATIDQLDALPRIGPVLAQRIADYRAKQGPFQDIEDIKQVNGIGDVVFAAIKDLITVE